LQTVNWNPEQYERFREQRMLPFADLAALVRPQADMRVIDLGCGTGELTALLAERFENARVVGIDSSPEMLERAAPRAGDRVRFQLQDIAEVDDYDAYDLVFSHAALQWVPDNRSLMARMLARMKPGSQLAVQVPKNEGHPSHASAIELAQEPPFAGLLGGFVRWSHTLPMEQYAELLHDHGFREQVCFEKIYGHELPSTEDVVEWVKGTGLNAYLSRLDDSGKAAFLAAYRERLFAAIGHRAPYFYSFRRLLIWGQKA
jgi:trans-aconitate 2-methyltransferase